MRAGEGAFHRTEQFAFDQFARQGGAIDLDDPPFAARAHRVDQVGDDFLAGAAFTGDEDRNIAGSDALDGADHRLHGRALKHGRGTAAHRRQRAPQGAVLFVLLLVFQRAFDRHQEAVGIERLVEKMISAALGGFHRGIEGRIAGQHDDLGRGPLLLDLRQQIEPVGVGQFDVEEHHVRLGFGERLAQRGTTLGFGDFVIAAQNSGQQLTDIRRVIYNQYGALHSLFFAMQHTGPRKRSKNSPMLRITICQAFRMKLNGQQERKQTDCFRLQFHAFHNSILAGCGHLQRLRHTPDRLVMRAVHAQLFTAGHLGQ